MGDAQRVGCDGQSYFTSFKGTQSCQLTDGDAASICWEVLSKLGIGRTDKGDGDRALGSRNAGAVDTGDKCSDEGRGRRKLHLESFVCEIDGLCLIVY